MIKMEYLSFKYLYPPRPDYVLTKDRITHYEKEGWAAQYKKNGTCTIIAMSPEGEFHAMNRHAEEHKAWNLTEHIKKVLRHYLPKGHWTVLVGEILHSKTPTIKDTIYIHDVIVHLSKQLVGSSFEERQILLEKLLPNGIEHYSHFEIDPFVWKAKLFRTNIEQEFLSVKDPKIDEGVVLKKLNGKLKPCVKADSNSGWQAKVRYPTKNYQF